MLAAYSSEQFFNIQSVINNSGYSYSVLCIIMSVHGGARDIGGEQLWSDSCGIIVMTIKLIRP